MLVGTIIIGISNTLTSLVDRLGNSAFSSGHGLRAYDSQRFLYIWSFAEFVKYKPVKIFYSFESGFNGQIIGAIGHTHLLHFWKILEFINDLPVCPGFHPRQDISFDQDPSSFMFRLFPNVRLNGLRYFFSHRFLGLWQMIQSRSVLFFPHQALISQE